MKDISTRILEYYKEKCNISSQMLEDEKKIIRFPKSGDISINPHNTNILLQTALDLNQQAIQTFKSAMKYIVDNSTVCEYMEKEPSYLVDILDGRVPSDNLFFGFSEGVNIGLPLVHEEVDGICLYVKKEDEIGPSYDCTLFAELSNQIFEINAVFNPSDTFVCGIVDTIEFDYSDGKKMNIRYRNKVDLTPENLFGVTDMIKLEWEKSRVPNFQTFKKMQNLYANLINTANEGNLDSV